MTPKPPPSPKHLSSEARSLWRSVLADYRLEPHHLAILQAACEALDRAAGLTQERELLDLLPS